jgi:membrane-bound lytic murein transglycosylase A
MVKSILAGEIPNLAKVMQKSYVTFPFFSCFFQVSPILWSLFLCLTLLSACSYPSRGEAEKEKRGKAEQAETKNAPLPEALRDMTLEAETGGAGEAERALSPACPPVPACPAPDASDMAGAASAERPSRLEAGTWADLPGWRQDNLTEAWSAFQESCRGLPKVQAGKANRPLWLNVCAAAESVNAQDGEAVRHFFERHFVPHAVVESENRREGRVTGYYEPLIQGSRQRDARNHVPVLGVPPDMLTIELGEVFPDLKHRRLRGRLVGDKVLPYWSRAEIDARENRWPGKTLLWVQDPVEFFFLQIQGSGRVQLPDGSRVRIGYADQNGHPYQSVGRLLVERGELKLEEASMQGIQAWARAHPESLRDLLHSNPSYVFFRELPNTESGPIGALGVPLTPGRSIAVDPRHIPLGAPVWLVTSQPNSHQPLNRLVLAQDTGGAIRGAIRADFFWGFGKQAGELAGRMKQPGRMWVLLPVGATKE